MYMLKTLSLDKNVTKKSGDQYSGLTAINKNTRAHSDFISPSPISSRVAKSKQNLQGLLNSNNMWLNHTNAGLQGNQSKTRNITDFIFHIMVGIFDAEYFQSMQL